ncbi:hypothetical protein evm_011027 [Chilo suppressalis]|nr:hypothetical protein evm_011027 [Chilo suppressalis]
MSVVLDNEEGVPFEEALDRTGFGLYSVSMTALGGVVIISFVCIFYSSTIVVPVSACQLNTTGAQQGMLVAGPIVGVILGAMFWGYVADQHGRKKTLLTSLIAGATINAFASLSTDWFFLLILQFIASLMISGQYSLAMTLVSESVPLAKRNIVVLMVTCIFLLSQGLMAVMAMPIVPLTFSYRLPYLDIYWTSWRLLLVIYSLPSLFTALWLNHMQESPKFVYSKGTETKALDILKIIYRINNRDRSDEFKVKSLMRRTSINFEYVPRNHCMLLFTQPLLKYTLIMTLLFLLEQLAAFKVWLPTIAHRYVQVVNNGEGRNLTLCSIIASSLDDPKVKENSEIAARCGLDFEALLIVLVITMMLSVTNAIMTMAVGRFGRRNMVMIITLISGGSGMLVNLVPNSVASAALFVLQLLGIVVIGLYTALCMTLFPTRLRALAMTLTMTGARVANFMSIQVINYLLIHSCDLAFYIYGAMLAFSAVVAYFLPRDTPTTRNNHQILHEESFD